MPIVDYSGGDKETYRAAMLEMLRGRKRNNPDFKVVDVGGRHNPWADDVVDAYVDYMEFETDKRQYVGDVNDEDVWREVAADRVYDFSICSHVLEDIRDPIVGLRWLPKISKAGFLGLPLKHREFSNSKSSYWLGQPQHNWVYAVKPESKLGKDVLITLPKWHSIHYFNTKTDNYPPLGEDDADLGPRSLDWYEEALSGNELELGIIWDGDIPFWTPDYTMLPADQIRMFREMLAGTV